MSNAGARFLAEQVRFQAIEPTCCCNSAYGIESVIVSASHLIFEESYETP